MQQKVGHQEAVESFKVRNYECIWESPDALDTGYLENFE